MSKVKELSGLSAIIERYKEKGEVLEIEREVARRAGKSLPCCSAHWKSEFSWAVERDTSESTAMDICAMRLTLRIIPSVMSQFTMDHEPGRTITRRAASAAVATTATNARGKKRLRGHRMVSTTNQPASATAQPRSRYQTPPRAGTPTATNTANIAAIAAGNLRKPSTIVRARKGTATNTPALDTERMSVMTRRAAALGQVRSSATALAWSNGIF